MAATIDEFRAPGRFTKPVQIDDLEAIEKLIEGLSEEKRAELARMPGIAEQLGGTCVLTERQELADKLLRSDATHCMLFGGARSGKTFLILRKIIERGLIHESRHAVLRFRFNHVVASVVHDTLPKVMRLCFPNVVDKCNLDRSLWFYKMPNGSEIWFGGLDEKERTEKILGMEYASILFNECSQITLASRNMALTRLAQNTPLSLKAYYDCNPPGKKHWTYRTFIEKLDSSRSQPLADPENYSSLLINPDHNRENLPVEYVKMLDGLPERQRLRFLHGIFADESENVLWTPEMLDRGRLIDKDPPEMQRVMVAVDPSGCSGPEDARSDEIGIIVVGLGTDGRGYVLEDLSGRFGPDQWKIIVASAFSRHAADAVVAEMNYGGAMVREVIRTAESGGRIIPFREAHASRGKVVRAEPIAALFEQGRVSLVGRFPELEDQLGAMTTAGYMGEKSPDRADAMIWGLSEIFPAMTRKSRSHVPKIRLGYSHVKKRMRK